MSRETPSPRITHAAIVGSKFTEKNKSLEVQAQSASTSDGLHKSIAWSDYYDGSWCVVAVPDKPDLDPHGQITGACEAYVIEESNELTVLGTKDVRYAKYGQDLKPGESAFFNKFGSRIALTEKAVSVVAKGGGFFAFDIEKKKFSLSGFPEKAGDGAPYITISPTKIGLVSASGQASMAMENDQATLSGAAISLDAGSIALGKDAQDYVALASLVMQALEIMKTWMNSHSHSALGASSSPPLLMLPNIASMRVKCG